MKNVKPKALDDISFFKVHINEVNMISDFIDVKNNKKSTIN